uniref:Putative transposase n=1 Tax=viral metagenome TaxID=1070528 RepID=A0A6M3IM90_9ZZZZ
MIKAHEIKLYPTKLQESFFVQSCGTSRFSYNWALSKWKEKYERKENVSAYSLIKELTSIKREQFPWMLNVGKTCPQYSIHNLEKAFKHFFKGNAKYPKFKKKGVHDSFVTVENLLGFKQNNYKIWIPRLGWVKCAENLRFKGKVNNVTVKRIANIWFAVINIDLNEIPAISENQTIVGVDLGLKHLATTSEGVFYENPKALKSKLSALRYQQRRFSKKVNGSNNKQKQQMKLARLHYRVACIRKDALHKITSELVREYGIIVLEDLNVSGMTKNHKLAQVILDVGLYEFRRQIEYKVKWQGKEVIIADRFFASSKICSCCGWKNVTLKLSDRTFKCNVCGNVIDRDLNAAKNLAEYGSTVRLTGSNACEDGSSVSEMRLSPSEKQEIALFDNNLISKL